MAEAKYAEWAERWARGMELSQPLIKQRRAAAVEVAKANRAKGAKTLCGIKDCKRHAYKGRVCRKHYALVPYSARTDTWVQAIQAQMKATERGQRRYLSLVREALRDASA